MTPLVIYVLTKVLQIGWWVLVIALGINTADILRRGIEMYEFDMTSKVVMVAIILVVATCYYTLARWSAYAKAKKDAVALSVRESNGQELTLDEKIAIKKAENFSSVYKFAIGIGIIMTAVLGSLVMLYVAPNYVNTSESMYLVAFAVGVVVAVVIDKIAIETTADGLFEKTKMKIWEAFRRAPEVTPATEDVSDVANLKSQIDALSLTLSGLIKK